MSGPYDQQAATVTTTTTARRAGRNESSTSSSSSNDGARGGHGGVAFSSVQAAPSVQQQFAAEGQFVQQSGYGGGFSGGYGGGYSGGFGGGYAQCNESSGSIAVGGPRRQGRYQKQVIRLPDQQGQVRQVRRRLPTPEPDTLEKV